VSMTGSRRRAIHATFRNTPKTGASCVSMSKLIKENSTIHSALTVIA
jgi:hypothetical protein